MTQQEAGALAARLTRIWGPEKPATLTLLSDGDGPEVDIWLIEISLHDGLELEAYTSEWGSAPSFFMSRWNEEKQNRTFLLALDEDEDWEVRGATERQMDEMNQLPFFKRGCWLSGCPIEGSAHEKVEWMQGFSHEEIEAWKLKI